MSASTFIIVPAHNEASSIAPTLAPLIEAGYTIVVVDDGSSDNTAQAAAGLPVHLLQHPVNLGQGAALQTGMTYAIQQGAEFLVHFDADGQHLASDIPRLLEPLQADRADIVFGSRFLRQGDAAAIPPLRRLVLRGGVIVNGLLTGLWLSDAHNGLRALNRRAGGQINLRENGYAHATEILSEVCRLRLRWVEQPTHIVYNEYALLKGQSLWNSINILIELLLRRLLR